MRLRPEAPRYPKVSAANDFAVRPPLVWIVDDSPLEAELVRRSLLPVFIAEIFTDAAAMLEHASRATTPDAIILDWEMPGISGIEVCHFLRTQPATQSIPILMLTVHRETRDLVQGLAAGADDFLPKPYSAAELSARISALVRGKVTRERADQAERDVHTLLMQFPEAVVSVDDKDCIVFVNLEAQRMLGADASSLQGKRLQALFDGAVFARAEGAGDQPVAIADVRRGDRVYSPVLRTYAGIDKHQTTYSFRDVTNDRRHDEERARLLARERDARREAETANRAKDEFLAVVSHELRTPLNAMVGWMQLLRSGTLPPERRAQALETVERNALAQKKLVEDILDISRIISGNLRLAKGTVDVAACVRASLDAIRPSADAKGLELDVAFGPDLAPIEGDVDRLQQMVWNLLSNAVKFTPRGGRVSVAVTREGGSVTVLVRDTGQGIPGAFLPHIFERFRQADTGTTRQHGGLGLGLAIVKSLANLHGGTIEADSAGPGSGATFSLRLPVSTGTEAMPGTRMTPTGVRSTGETPMVLTGTLCLVVEDNDDTRELVATLLRQQGARVSTAGTVAEALAEVEREEPSIVVSDIGLPVEDGYALARKLCRHPARAGGMRLLALTAFAATEDRARALEAGFDAFVPKPVDPSELISTIDRLTRE
jgi:signal transduction histidine kinase